MRDPKDVHPAAASRRYVRVDVLTVAVRQVDQVIVASPRRITRPSAVAVRLWS